MTIPQQLWLRLSGILVIVAVLGGWLWMEMTPTPRIPPAPGQAIDIDKTPQAQAERKTLIDAMIAKGLVKSVDAPRGGTLRMSLRGPFYVLDDATRRAHVDTVYRYYFDGSNVNDTVILRDARHGNEIGQYNPYKGGLNIYK